MAIGTQTTNAVGKQFDEILSLNLDECSVTVCLASISGNDEEPAIAQLQLSDELADEFRAAVKKSLQQYSQKSEANELALRPYDAGSKPDSHEVEYLNVKEHETVEKQVESLAVPASIPMFTVNETFISGLRFYAVIAQPRRGKPLCCFRVYTPKKELSRSHMFAAMFTEGAFNQIRQPVFLFDHGIDCVSRDPMIFVFSKHNFERIFRFFELVLKMAEQTLRTIKTYVPIANFDEFQQACEGHLQMQAKLKNIAGKPYLKSVKIEHIKRVLKEFPDLRVRIVKKGNKEMLLFDPKDKWAVLRLLDDDYLGSVLTGEKYEVTGKRPYQR